MERLLRMFDWWIHNSISEATYVSSYPNQIVVELEQSDEATYHKHLSKLPDQIVSLPVGYVNGKIIMFKHSRSKAPNAQIYDSTFDDSDYLLEENGGTLRLGILLECIGKPEKNGTVVGLMYTNAGVKITNGNEVRFTAAKHGKVDGK